MIDPKLNVSPSQPTAASPTPGGNKDAATARLQKVSSGLSVNDTIASNANLSVGAQGVNTSGVSSGAGAGAGMTRLDSNPQATTEVVPGGRGSGTTALGSSNAQATKANFPDAGQEYTDTEVSELAYAAWCDRGCPNGSPEVDWQTALDRLQSGRTKAAGA